MALSPHRRGRPMFRKKTPDPAPSLWIATTALPSTPANGFYQKLDRVLAERAFAARCADSLSVRSFLHYELTEATPEHSSFTVIRKRLPLAVYEAVFALIVAALYEK